MGCERPVEALQQITALDERTRAKVLGGNAARMLGL
jgi:hypothetical protein